MATPSKQNPGATPTYLTSSPRPSSGPMHRPMALKSPSTRTLSASGHGHGNQPSSSTQQYATPLAVTAENDNAISFSSPSALLGLNAYGGISPSPAVHDALVGSGMNDGDIQALGIQGLKLGNGRDNEEERRRHIEEVVELLRARVAGRGVSREGVERLAELERFESIWQDDNLNIAGNFVDLEIEFYRGQNVVKSVRLAYVTPEATDGEPREDATAVLKRDLLQSPEEGDQGSWKDLGNFHKNLRWLARHDKLSDEVNCFEAIEGLHKSLQRIWDEEGPRRKFSGDYEHLCTGWVGRPSLHRGGRIGLWLDYWVPRARVLDAKRRKSPDAMAMDQPEQSDDEESSQLKGNWRIAIECEEGYPSLRVSKDWIGSEVFTEMNTEAPTSGETESDIAVVNWAEPQTTSRTSNQSEGVDLEPSMMGSSPNRRFVARLEPPLDLPTLAAADIYRHLGMQMPQDFKMLSYDGLLAPGWSPLSAAVSLGLSPEDTTLTGRRRSKIPVRSFDDEGKPTLKLHSYTFQPFEPAGGRTLKDIPFSHPRQLADILPTLRQYAFLANLVRSIFPNPAKDDESRSSDQARQEDKDTDKPISRNITILSNENPNEKKLNLLLGLDHADPNDTVRAEEDLKTSDDELKVDVTLRTQMGQAPVIMLLFTVDNSITSTLTSTFEDSWSKVSLSFEVGLNGRVSVVDVAGLLDDDNPANGPNADAQATGEPMRELQSRLSRVLETSQDIGILVEWVRRWVRQRKSRG
ncbi:mediator of RNA polymerase II transcription subunit 1-domain-containing protein [Aspergillus egyptiacus]|nr:mediator of RNA polymerase II transcription subunit 1-domain-containing protein [Aspergillus egyptiacus]